MRSWMRVMVLVVVPSLIVVGCSGGDGESTTTVPSGTVTTLPEASTGTTDTPAADVTTSGVAETVPAITSTIAAGSLPAYQIAFRGDGDDQATVVVLLDSTSYTALSDIDLQEVIRDVYDQFPPVFTAYVVDHEDAIGLVLLDRALTEEEVMLLDEHYLARLEDGIRILYVGPFEEYPMAILGS